VSAPAIAILDYGMGNLRSVEKALEHVGAAVEITSDRAALERAAGLILPGVGAFPKAMEAVRDLGLDRVLEERVAAGTPVLGICLGMQLLFERSTELGGAEGIGLLPGSVDALEAPGLKLPQIGWNEVRWRRPSRLTAGLPDPAAFYHVHSFAAEPSEEADALGAAAYGAEFVSAVERGSVYGVQFHPEKSGPHGLQLLSNFAAICVGSAAATAA
jgi:glutamine amidotransferase